MSNGDKPKYKGPSEATTAMGQSYVDGMTGSTVGIVAGIAAGAATHKPELTKKIKAALETKNLADLHEEGVGWKHGRMPNEGILEEAERFLEQHKGWRRHWHNMERGGKMFAGALAGFFIAGAIGNIVGYFRGINKAKAAREQFDDITAENQALKHTLNAIEVQAASGKSFTATLDNERNKPAEQGRGV